MERALNYPFKRKSTSFLDWLHDYVKSEKYFEVDSMIVTPELAKTI